MTVVSVVSCLAGAASAGAEEAMVVERGTRGLDPVPFRAENRSDAALACGASIAHWYSTRIGRAEPGGAVEATFWSDAATGTVYVLNDVGDRMPILALWCGREGEDVSTGARILLQRRAGSVEPPVALACAAQPGKSLDCRPVPGP